MEKICTQEANWDNIYRMTVLPFVLVNKKTYYTRKTTFTRGSISFLIIINLLIAGSVNAQKLSDYSFKGAFGPVADEVRNEVQFNGYTNYWHNDYKEWIRYGNLFKMSVPIVSKTIAQSKIDIAEDLQIPGLSLQEGFISGLFSSTFKTVEAPSLKELEEAIASENVLVFTDPGTEAGKKLVEKFVPDSLLKRQLKSYQFNTVNFKEVNAFVLENGARRIFVVESTNPEALKRVKELLDNTKKVLSEYDLHKGWFGAETLLKSVTCTQGHPLEVIGKGMNEGNTWFVFSGYMDFWMKDELSGWVNKANLPVVADVGFSPIFGCKDYKDIQIQDMVTKQSWIDYAHHKNGYIFRPVYDAESDPYHYDGYLATEGNKKQIDNENVPFISTTGSTVSDLIPSMVLFIKKGEKLTRDLMWEAIMDRREVAVLGQGKMMGPALYRNALQLLLLDRQFLEDYFGDRIDLQVEVQDYTLQITVSNTYAHAVSGTLNLQLPPEVKVDEAYTSALSLPAYSSKTILIKVRSLASGMNATNPIVANFSWDDKKKTTMTILDLPPAISVHQLLYGHAPSVKYLVSIHNFSSDKPFPVQVQVFAKDKPGKAVFTATQNVTAPLSKFQDMLFDLKLAAGDYTVKVSALGVIASSQLGVGKAEGIARAYPIDLNSDGVNEYRLENDSVQVKMVADYYGNRLEKTFTLYGNSPLVEIRFALTFQNPEANVIGPTPILELGAVHGTEDVSIIPSVDGLQQFRMKPERYYGHLFNMKEGWNAGYDEKEDITYVGAYPVSQPLFLHMWMNHPSNGDAHYYFSEFQPWVPIKQKSTMYFSYYIWGAGGPWENGVTELRKRNLITVQ